MPSTPKAKTETPPIKTMTPVVVSPPPFFEVGIAVSLAAASAWPDAMRAASDEACAALPAADARAAVAYLDALELLCELYRAPEKLLRRDVPDILLKSACDDNATAPLRLFLRRAMLDMEGAIANRGVQPPPIDWDALP